MIKFTNEELLMLDDLNKKGDYETVYKYMDFKKDRIKADKLLKEKYGK